MGMNLDAIGKSFDWLVSGNIYGEPFEWVGKLAAVPTTRRNEIQREIGKFAELLRTDSSNPQLEELGPVNLAKELLLGWHDPEGKIIFRGEVLPDTPENVVMLIDTFPGVAEAVCLAFLEASNGEKARLGNSRSSHGFGAMARSANGRTG